MPPNLDWLLVGTGDIVKKRVAPALAQAGGGRLVGICGGRERAEALAREHNVPEVFDDLDTALAKTSAVAAYIATPVYRHADEATRALAAGKHVLIEKPLGLDAVDAERIAAAGQRSGHVVGCAYYRRCFPRFAHAKQAIASGELGKITLIRLHYAAGFNPAPSDPKSWRVQKSRSGGGVLADMGCHMLDQLIGLVGTPTAVRARVANVVHPYEVEDSAAAILDLPGGGICVADFHWNTKTWSHEIEIVGSEGRLRWSPADTGPVVKTIGREVTQLDLPNDANVHLPLVRDFIEAVTHGRPPVVPLEEAVKTNRVMDAIYASSKSGKEVRL
jgi:predicted dehydrogenase